MASQAVRIALAATLAESPYIPEVQRAVALDPDNPGFLHRLGLLYSYSPAEPNPAEGVKNLRRAVELDPLRAAYWADLGSACGSTSDAACADRAIERARVLAPLTPRVQWFVANHYLQTDRVDAALQTFRRILELAPEYAWPTFRLCLRAVKDPERIYQEVLPAGNDPKLKLAFLTFLSERGDLDDAYRIWARAAASMSPPPFSAVGPYLYVLLGRGRFQEAQSVWLDLQRRGVIPKPRPQDQDNLIYNGGFEQTPLNAGFDWRYGSVPYLLLDFSDPSAYRGASCFRVDFTASRNEEYEAVTQIVPVEPNQSYLLTAYVRSDSITSDSGPRLRMVDLGCRECPIVTSETTVGTTSWHPVSLNFTTGPQSQAVRIGVWRARGRSFPTEITGTFWLDEVSLVPMKSSGEKAAPTRPR